MQELQKFLSDEIMQVWLKKKVNPNTVSCIKYCVWSAMITKYFGIVLFLYNLQFKSRKFKIKWPKARPNFNSFQIDTFICQPKFSSRSNY